MTRDACHKLTDAVDALADGRFDDVAPDVLDEVTTHLDNCPQCAARIFDTVASPSAPFERDTSDVAASTWEEMWGAVEATAIARPRRSVGAWASMAAAAVIILATAVWQLSPAPTPAWELNLASRDDVDIEFIDAYGADVYTVEVDGMSIIWVSEE